MICRPASVQELTEELVRASNRGEQGMAFDLAALNRVIEYNPADMTVTVETGMALSALQEQLARCGQWLPIDPPNPDKTTILEILNANASGPHRFGYGTIREHLLGLAVALADGRLIHGGGKVVKNVAGYDLCKLFVGSRGSLGVIVEATFKVRPLSEAEQIVTARCDSFSHAGTLLEAIQQSELTPVILDLVCCPPFRVSDADSLKAGQPPLNLVLALAGTREEVDWQLEKAAQIGVTTAGELDYEKTFWGSAETAAPHRLSVLPSRVIEALGSLGASQFVARAGNGTIYYRGGNPPPKTELPLALMARIKEAYDPKHILPDF